MAFLKEGKGGGVYEHSFQKAMNNFRNPYVDPDSFQGKVYDYYKNPTNPHNIHFSIDNQGGSEQKETQQSQEDNQSNKIKKPSIYINHQLEKMNDSKPVLFPLPKVNSIQKHWNENTIDELTFNIDQSKNSKNDKMDKKEVISNLIKKFSLMIEDKPSIHEVFTTLQEGKFENDSLLNSGESTSISENKLGNEYTNDADYKNVTENHVHTKQENSELLFDKFHSMLNERDNHLISDGENIKSLNKNNDTLEDKFYTMLSESDDALQEEKQDIDKNEEDHDTLEDKFYTMLSESDDALQEEKQDIDKNEEDHDTLKDKFYTMLSESDDALQEEKQNIDKNEEDHDALEDKFHTMLSESDDALQEEEQNIDTNEEDHDALEDKFYTMLSESDDALQEEKQNIDTNEEGNDALNQNNDKMEDKFYTMLSESDDALQEEKQDGSFTNLKETKPIEIEVLSKDEPHLYHKKPSLKKEKKRRYYITKNNPYNKTCMKEVDDEQFFRKNTHLIDPVEKKETTTVKIQVLLTRLEIDIDIVETIDLLMPLENILKVEWSIHSLDCKVVLPSKTVFIKGEFTAEIEFSNKGLENKIQSFKVSIPWSKTANINWISIPDFSYSNKNEFMFQSEHEHDPSFHYKYFQKFVEPIRSQLKQINFVWHQKLNSKDQQLQVNGVAQLLIHLMQEQFVDLECYSK